MDDYRLFKAKTDLDLGDYTEEELLREEAYIKKVGDEWCVYSEGGRSFGCYGSRKAAEKRLKQIEMFKHMKSGLETARWMCYCQACGAEFYSNRRCDQSRCPECGEQDDIVEITGDV